MLLPGRAPRRTPSVSLATVRALWSGLAVNLAIARDVCIAIVFAMGPAMALVLGTSSDYMSRGLC